MTTVFTVSVVVTKMFGDELIAVFGEKLALGLKSLLGIAEGIGSAKKNILIIYIDVIDTSQSSVYFDMIFS